MHPNAKVDLVMVAIILILVFAIIKKSLSSPWPATVPSSIQLQDSISQEQRDVPDLNQNQVGQQVVVDNGGPRHHVQLAPPVKIAPPLPKSNSRLKESKPRRLTKSSKDFSQVGSGNGVLNGTAIPKKIWQKWKNRIDPQNIWSQEDYIRESWLTWRAFNPGWEHTVFSDIDAENFVRTEYADRPDIVKVYVELQQRVIAFDLLRYLLIYKYEGVYTDIDTTCRIPIDEWFEQFQNYGIVVGIESILTPDGQHSLDWQMDRYQLTGRIQFLQWAVMAQPGHIVLNRTIETLVAQVLNDRIDSSGKVCEIEDLWYEDIQILRLSGPGLWTKLVREYINAIHGRAVGDEEIAHMQDIRKYGDLLLLTKQKWAPAPSGSEDGMALLRHHWKGNWR
ncbi:hypothetical protein H072_4568 [Dactylellina haptotyla CBS 200.50]|uniref:Initiation-specific alpha-1,6-mannosyltransferase n=1 Tax=Dactylellina haptotyla (strain CBS 200.50) TaxID=1284197 RepID=S8BPZ8_DACHA|nr:hypothetical protein H072_4568 [Dactylellina haptotyla CBS 200.50]